MTVRIKWIVKNAHQIASYKNKVDFKLKQSENLFVYALNS